MRFPPYVRGGRAAVVFLTRIPVGGFPYRSGDWKWSTGWFPAVGLLVGGLMSAAWWLGSCAGVVAGAFFAVGAGLLITGAFHEDGLADTADALGGAYDREKLHEILKDSRIGTFGASALVIVMGLRIALLSALGDSAPPAMVLTQALARTPPVWLMIALPYVTTDPVSKSRRVARADWRQALLATGFGGLALVLGYGAGWLRADEIAGCVVTMMLVAALCAWRFFVRAGGITGDFLGATEQIAECGLLFVLVSV